MRLRVARGRLWRLGTSGLENLVQIFEILFADRQAFSSNCYESGDANNSGAIDIGDGVWILNYIFVPDSPPPAAPFPDCGLDPDNPSGEAVGAVPTDPGYQPGCAETPVICQ